MGTLRLKIRCLVHGCPNHEDEGTFVGPLCSPCHIMLVTGEVKYGVTFIHRMRNTIDALACELGELGVNHA